MECYQTKEYIEGKVEKVLNNSNLHVFPQILKSVGADPTLEDDIDGDDLLKVALRRSANFNIINFLIKEICPPSSLNSKNKSGSFPLVIAVSNNRISDDTILLLIKKGANPFSLDSDGNTLLHNIIHYRRPFSDKMVKLIADYADQMKNVKNNHKVFPLMKLLSIRGYQSLQIPEAVFGILIPNKDIINDKNVIKNDDGEYEEGTSCLERLVAFPYVGDEREPRIRKLVAAGAVITDEVIQEGIKHGIKTTDVLLELQAIPQIDHLKCCLESANHDGIALLKTILPKIPNGKQIVKNHFPDILLQSLRYMRLKNTCQIDLAFVSLLLDEYGIDINYSQPQDGSLLHWLCYMQFLDEERAEFLKKLIEKHGSNFNLNILCPRDRDIEWGTEPVMPSVVPLQVALENRSFLVAQVLIRNFAAIDLVFSSPSMSATCLMGKNDEALYVVVRMLKFLGENNLHLITLQQQIEEKYKKSEEVQKQLFEVPSLLEMSCQLIRKNSTLEQVNSFINNFDLGPKVREFMFLEHIKEIKFPPRIPIVGTNDSDEDYDYDDDDDDEFLYSEEEYGYDYDSDQDIDFENWFA